jgi:hypothetical protein
MNTRLKANAAAKRSDEPVQESAQELQNGLQQAVARNYRQRPSHPRPRASPGNCTRIRQSHENETNELLTVMDASRKQAAETQRCAHLCPPFGTVKPSSFVPVSRH